MPLANKQADSSQRLQQALQLHKHGQFDQAALCYEAILKTEPTHFDAMHLLGVLRSQQGLHAEALVKIQTALKWRPTSAEALSNLGLVFLALAQPEEALASYDKALALRPNYAEALNHRGGALLALGRPEEALASYDKALAFRPNYAQALNNRGVALLDLGRPEEALASCDRALAIRPDYAEALNNRGLALLALRRPEDALVSFDRALAIRPDYANALYNRGLACLQLGDFENGWMGYENRWNTRDAPDRELKAYYPVWHGENVSGKRVIVYEEQGLGDIIQFSRYLKKLSELGAQTTFLVRSQMHKLLRSLDQTVRLVDKIDVGESFDYQCALMSLPIAFGTTLENIPAETQYMQAEPERVLKWKDRLGGEGFKIGVAWQGGKAGRIDIGRSFALTEFFRLSRLPNVRLISLQKGEGVEQLRDMPEGMAVETLGADFDVGADAFLDAAAVMENVDLVITSDTSVAHLAGALGRPVWVALKYAPDWRWMLDRTESRWYPTMRLFRQRTMDDWKGVFSEIESALGELMGEERQPANDRARKASTPRVPISWGELIDKITILEIKSVEIVNEVARANVTKELFLLQDVAATHPACDQVLNLKSNLKGINAELWKIEDAIREKERKNQFDEEFIELARSVYQRNDERAMIKRKINTVLASEIIEEKSYKNQCAPG